MKTLYRGALVLWLVSGFGLHAYFSRATLGTAEVQEKRDLHRRQSENNEAVARQVREAHWDAKTKRSVAHVAWAFVGLLLALPAARSLFRKADNAAALDKFLTAALVLILLPGCMRQPFEPVKLETIGPNEEFLRASLVATEPIRIPQGWTGPGRSVVGAGSCRRSVGPG